ncbi:MAG: hypothetical protein CBD44_00665 [Flavobacteriaceae bacterium TMED184]|nr:MAG: hypothetical protein CBD44_00665 [Flavobacteriaceae bacterium TMED184]|tara:strand:+ start:851 stop:1771 length:921 start_codon:yes stop_codon:yes gene_type:complete
MKKLILYYLIATVSFTCISQESNYPYKWPMYNDINVDLSVENPSFEFNEGPLVMIDAAHKNFFVQSHLIKPLVDIVLNDGYRVSFIDKKLTKENLNQAKILIIITALPFDFATQSSAAGMETYTENELNEVQAWVNNGGSLLVFSEHAPFDQAINPLLKKFEIESSVGVTIDTLNYDKSYNYRMIVFKGNNLNNSHPLVNGKYEVKKLVSFGGSALSGEKYDNILKLGNSSLNVKHQTGNGPLGSGNSQGLAGFYGKGKVVAFGDSNGFTAMIFNNEDGSKMYAGMNSEGYDWKNFVLNTFDWLSK